MRTKTKRKDIPAYGIILLFLFMTHGLFAQNILGDVNTDSEVDIVDALLIAQYYVGLNPPQFLDEQAGDVNCDRVNDIVDALLIAQYYVGVIYNLPCQNPTRTPTIEPAISPTETPFATPSGNINILGTFETGIGHRERWINAIFLGNYFYVTSLRGIKIFQAAEPDNPVFIKDTDICAGSELMYLEITGNLLLGLDVRLHELLLIDVSDPLNPSVVNRITTYDITDFAHKGNYVFLAVEDYLVVLNIANPLKPVEEVRLSEMAGALSLEGDILYSIIDTSLISDDFKIFDVSSPTNPVLITSIEQEGSDICTAGNYAYIRYLSKLRVYDISDPSNPYEVFPLSTSYSIDINFFYSGQGYYPQSLYKIENTLFYARQGGISMIDVSDVDDIDTGEWTALPGFTSEGINDSVALTYTNGNLFIISSDMEFGSCIHYIDTTASADPVLTDFIEGRGCAYGPYLSSSSKVYLPDGMGGVKILDTINPENPVMTDIINTEIIYDITPGNYYLYGLDRSLLVIDKMTDQVIEYSDPVDSGYQCQSITSYDHYLYIPRFPRYIKIIDISNPLQPVFSSAINLEPSMVPTSEPTTEPSPVPGTPESTIAPTPTPTPLPSGVPTAPPDQDPLKIIFNNDYGYLIQTLQPPLRIFDMSEPSALVEVGSYYPDSATRSFKDIIVHDDVLYIAANDGLLLLSLANPVSPVRLSYIEITGIKKLVKDNYYCFIVQEPSHLVVVDVSDTSDSRIVEVIDTGIYIEDLAVLNRIIYCSNGQEKAYMSIYSYESTPYVYSRP